MLSLQMIMSLAGALSGNTIVAGPLYSPHSTTSERTFSAGPDGTAPAATAPPAPPKAAAYEHNGQTVTRERFYAIACDPRRHVAVEACAGAGPAQPRDLPHDGDLARAGRTPEELAKVPQVPRLERFDGRGKNEHTHGLREMLAHLARALPIDFKQDVPALFEGLVDPVPRRAVIIAVYFGPFEQGALIPQRKKMRVVDKTIVLLVFFARAGRTRGA